MASPVVEAIATSSDGSSVSTFTIDCPAGVQAGDLLIAMVVSDVEGAIFSNWSDSFTQLYQGNFTSGRWAIAYKQSDGSEGANVTVDTDTAERAAHLMLRISGHEDPATQAPEKSTGATGSSDSADPDTVTPTGGAKDYLFIAIAAYDAGYRSVGTWPASHADNRTEIAQASGGSLHIATRAANAASDNPNNFVMDATETWAAMTLAVHPAAAASVAKRGAFKMDLQIR